MIGKRLEVHTHSIITGPNANKSWCNTITHSHEGGDRLHSHEDTGPGAYTIDKDEWLAATGLRGGGRKKFTARPSGPQLPLVTSGAPTKLGRASMGLHRYSQLRETHREHVLKARIFCGSARPTITRIEFFRVVRDDVVYWVTVP